VCVHYLFPYDYERKRCKRTPIRQWVAHTNTNINIDTNTTIIRAASMSMGHMGHDPVQS
jgi:hypothetical protein